MSDVRYYLQECLERVFILFFNIDYCADVFLVAGEWYGEECSLINTSPYLLTRQKKNICAIANIKEKYRVFFFTGTPLKKLKYGKPRLGEFRCI